MGLGLLPEYFQKVQELDKNANYSAAILFTKLIEVQADMQFSKIMQKRCNCCNEFS
jgi:hypothetical protein